MIFKKYFRPKHQHSDAEIRIQAARELSPDSPEHKSRLHELAFNDSDPRVNIAALQQLNSFALWCKMAQTANTEKVQKKAQTVVEDALHGRGDLHITEQERRQFIQECDSITVLEQTLSIADFAHKDLALMLEVLDKVNKPHLTQKLFLTTDIEALQGELLTRIDDLAVLNKALKRTPFASIRAQIETKVTALAYQKSRPPELEKATRLLLSKLLALTEQPDLGIVNDKRQALVQHYTRLHSEFWLLSESVRAALTAKYTQIEQQLNAHVAKLTPQWEQQQQRIQIQQQVAALETELDGLVTEQQQLLAMTPDSISPNQIAQLQSGFEDLRQHVQQIAAQDADQAALDSHKQDRLLAQISANLDTLRRLPELQSALAQASQLLAQFSQLSAPDDASQAPAAQQHLLEQKRQWKNLRTGFNDCWPNRLEQQWQQQCADWQRAVSQLQNQVTQVENKVKAKLRAINNLIQQGKFKAAMSLYERVQRWYGQLPEPNQAKLAKTFAGIKHEIENLQDWQSYIALPRKPALLDEMSLLASDPLPVKQQASEVKRIRSAWNSLGNQGGEADEALNLAFERAADQAFEPCRVHYAKLDQLREQNRQVKEQIIRELEEVQQAELSDQDFQTTVNRLQQRWRDVGPVDLRVSEGLNQNYRQNMQAIKQRLDALIQGNQEAKQTLLQQAEELLQSEDVIAAVAQCKALQQRWKLIGSAGNKIDNRLWKQFRHINDQVFARRQQQNQQHKQQLAAYHQQVSAQLSQLLSQAEQAQNSAELAHVSQQSSELSGSDEWQAAASGPLQKQRKLLEDRLIQRREQLQAEKQQASFRALFDTLKSHVNQPLEPSQLTDLASGWRQALAEKVKSEYDRHEIVILLDILNDIDSPAQDTAKRRQLQLQLMSKKLQDGEQPSPESLLKLWLSQGTVTDTQLPYLHRLEQHFTPSTAH